MKRTKIIALVVAILITFMIGLSQPAVASFTRTCTANCANGSETFTKTCIGNCGQLICFCSLGNPSYTFPCTTCYGGHICCKPAACLFLTTCPTSVIELISFSATSYDGKVIMLEWATDMEIDNVGFNIWRSETEDGEYIKITDNLISAQGSCYQYIFTDDAVVKGNTYYYKLEDIDLYGASTFHDPVLVRMSSNSSSPAIQFLLRH